MPPPSTERLQGTLAHSILKTLALEPIYGWGIAQPIQQVSQELLQVGQGSLNPALDRLEAKRWIRSEWAPPEDNRRARFDSLTRLGRKQMESEWENCKRMAGATALVLEGS